MNTPIEILADAVRSNTLPSHEDDAVNMHFFKVSLTEMCTLTAEELKAMIVAAEVGYYGDIPLKRLLSGPSYIEIGAWIGDQGLAMHFMALGNILGLWDIIIPETLGITGKQADEMAGMGFVMIGPKADSILNVA